MNIILFDDQQRTSLLPLTYTRPCGDLRVGILTLAEKWKILSPDSAISFYTEDYLSKKYQPQFTKDCYYINGRLIGNGTVLEEIASMKPNTGLMTEDDVLVAFRSGKKEFEISEGPNNINLSICTSKFSMLTASYDIFSLNQQEIENDFKLLTEGRTSAKASSSNTIIGDNIFIEQGAIMEAATINTTTGPVYIGKNALIMEGTLIRGPFAACEDAVVKMGAKIYGATTLGPNCKVGGEVSNVVFQARSNKGHDGFLGNSVIGEWCNLGADTNSSNLKNNYAPVKLWNYDVKRFINTGLQFCGLVMGDHSKCGINTMFNTGTVIGVSANIFGAGFPRNFIPSFTWGGSSGFSTYTIGKSFETASKVMGRRKLELTEVDKDILKHIFEASSEHRFWENKPLKA
jgi:UDP-N-acetylglucosamine diphosphorylase/glucosamine-1-phosphate N-acetyltransferase